MSLVTCPSWATEEKESAESSYATPAVSIIRLISVCDQFAGKQVMTTGYAFFHFENYKVCPCSELGRVDPSSCFWIRAGEDGIPDDELRELDDASGTFVTIEGRVGCSKHLYAGYLDQIQLIVELESGRVLWTTDPAMKAAQEEQ